MLCMCVVCGVWYVGGDVMSVYMRMYCECGVWYGTCV